MAWMRRFRNLFRPHRLDRDIDDELSFHVAERIDALMASGMSEREAHREARRQFGNYDRQRERTREMNTIRWAESLGGDIRHSLRTLKRDKAFAAVALTTLTLGIAANAAVFSLLSIVLWPPLPVEAPSELVVFGTDNARGVYGYADPVDWSDRLFSYPLYEQLRDGNTAFEELAAISSFDADMFVRAAGATGVAPEPVSARLVSGNYFRTLGVSAIVGRAIQPSDDENRGAHPVVVLSHGYWQRRFAEDTSIVGSRIQVGDRAFDVIGVAPPGFRGESVGTSPDIYVPLMMYEAAFNIWRLDNPESQHLILLGRLRDGMTLEAAETSLTLQFRRALAAQAGAALSTDRRERLESRQITLLRGQAGLSWLGRDFGMPLRLLMAAVALVLLVTCANIANLLVGRASARRREIAVRVALGAGRRRLIRQLLTENLLLSIGAGILAVFVAALIVRVLARTIFPDGPLPVDIGIDSTVLTFTLALSIATAALFGALPALDATRTQAPSTLRIGGRTGTIGGGGRSGLKKTLTIGQVAVALVLMVSAGLFFSNLENLRNADFGYSIDDVHVFALDGRSAGVSYADEERLIALERELLARVRDLAEVENASLSMFRLLDPRGRWTTTIGVDGYVPTDGEDPRVDILPVTSGYFETVGIPLLRGRSIEEVDGPETASVTVVNQAFADRYFAARNVLDGRVEAFDRSWQIVGVAADARYNQPRQTVPPKIFLPEYQLVTGLGALQVRSEFDTAVVAAAVRDALADIDPNLVILEATSLREQLDRILSGERLLSNLTGAFGVLGLLLAGVGVFGVMSYSVTTRTREIGLRVALGARTASVLRMVLAEAFVLVGLGAAGGLAAAYAATQLADRLLADGFLYNVTPSDPLVMTLATAALIAVTSAAVFPAARRAANVSPMVSLRHD